MPQHKWQVPATVVDVVDGDTVHLVLDLGWHVTYTVRARIAGIDAPELKTPEGVAAKAHAQQLLQPGDEVLFTSSSLDKYGRPLGDIHSGPWRDADFAADMVMAGHARYLSDDAGTRRAPAADAPGSA